MLIHNINKKVSIRVTLFLVIVVLCWFVPASHPGVNEAILPMVAAMLIGGAAGGLKGLLSGNPDEDRKNAILNILKQNRKKTEQDYEKRKGDMLRIMEQEKKQRRGTIAARNASEGLSGPTAIFSGEEPIITSGYRNISALGTAESDALSKIDDETAQANLLPSGENALSRFVGGGIEGANIGAGFGKSLGFLDPKNPGGMGDALKNLMGNTPDKTTGNNIVNPSMSYNDNTFKGIGDEDFTAAMNSMFSMSDKKKKKDETGLDWSSMSGMYNPFTSNNSMYRLK